MVATLFALLLIVSTSMIVNDYYDARSGVDYLKFVRNKRSPFEPRQNSESSEGTSSPSSDSSSRHKKNVDTNSLKPLATGEVPLPVAKQFLSILYGALLVSISVLPGTPARLLAMGGSIITFYYTKHIKPKTWMKNVSCALLMSLAPLTSGYATLSHPFVTKATMTNEIDFWMAWRGLGPLFCSLYCGFMGREMIMDMTDYDADKIAGINTVPVVHGKRMASKIIFLLWLASGIFISFGPAIELYSQFAMGSFSVINTSNLLSIMTFPAVQKLSFALLGSTWLVIRATQLVMTEGRHEALLEKAIEETKLSLLFILASSV